MIDYSLIDEECIPLVKYFNDIGLKTEFSCQGHDKDEMGTFQIIFDKSVTDDNMNDFIFKNNDAHKQTPFLGMFVKWMRMVNGEMACNWMYEITNRKNAINYEWAKEDLRRMALKN